MEKAFVAGAYRRAPAGSARLLGLSAQHPVKEVGQLCLRPRPAQQIALAPDIAEFREDPPLLLGLHPLGRDWLRFPHPALVRLAGPWPSPPASRSSASPGDKNVRLHIEGGVHNGRPTLTSEPFLIKIMVSRLEAALCTPCSLLRGASVTLLLHRAPLCAPLVHRLRAVWSLCSVTLPSLNGHCPSVPPAVQSISTPT
jgi:hypothetical protein